VVTIKRNLKKSTPFPCFQLSDLQAVTFQFVAIERKLLSKVTVHLPKTRQLIGNNSSSVKALFIAHMHMVWGYCQTTHHPSCLFSFGPTLGMLRAVFQSKSGICNIHSSWTNQGSLSLNQFVGVDTRKRLLMLTLLNSKLKSSTGVEERLRRSAPYFEFRKFPALQ
jgi:hypothetical protein